MNKLYTFGEIEMTDTAISADVTIHPEHAILKGHFPEQAVLPGVCQLEMIIELYSIAMKHEFHLQRAGEIKYPAMILPEKQNVFVIEISIKDKQDNAISCLIKNDHQVFLKAKLNLALQRVV